METNRWISPIKELPEPLTLCLIKRRNGSLYLGFRNANTLSTDLDASRNCYWYGNPIDDIGHIEGRYYRFSNNFSDVTVLGWQPLSSVSL